MSAPTSSWVRARGQIMFLLGLIVASAIILRIESAEFVPVTDVPPTSRLLRPTTEEVARDWTLVAGQQPDGSIADIGHTIKATLAGHRLDLLTGDELHARVTALIAAGRGFSPGDGSHAGPYVAALELVAWSSPSLRGAALEELSRWAGTPAAVTPAPVSPLQDAADRLLRAALVPVGGR